MHKVWFAQGVYGVDFRGMADHGELGDDHLGERERGKEFCFLVSPWSDIPFSYFKAVDSSAKHSLPYKHYIKF